MVTRVRVDTPVVPAASSSTSTDASCARVCLPVTLVGAGLGVLVMMVVASLRGLTRLNDFPREAWPALRALEHGHLVAFAQLAPAYGASLLLRAPFLPLAALFGNGWRGAYYATTVPCLIAAPLLGAWLQRTWLQVNGPGTRATRISRASPIVLCGLNPAVVIAISCGHPEELLGATLCVAAVVFASRGAGGWSAVLAGLAIANKPWALVAAPVVLAALPAPERRRALAITIATAGALLAPILLLRALGSTGGTGIGALGGSTGRIFMPPQLLYWLGRGSWPVHEAHVLIVLAGAGCAGLWWWQRRRGAPTPAAAAEALPLLALVLLLRGALDPWDNLYYQVPFLFAIAAYETGQAPRLTGMFSLLLLLAVPPHLLPMTPTGHAALYAAVAVPSLAWLAARTYLRDGIRFSKAASMRQLRA